MIRADSYRNKLETAQAFEIMKSDFERFGPRVWYMTLRKNNQDSIQYQKKIIKGREITMEREI